MPDKLPNYYEILGVSKNATKQEIKSQYAKLIQDCHPDKSEALRNKYKATNDSELLKVIEQAIAQAEEKTKLLNEAYGVLSNPDKRRLYDSTFVNIDIKPSKFSIGSIAQGRNVDVSFTIANRGGAVTSIKIDWLRKPTWGEMVIIANDPKDPFPIKVTVTINTVGLSPNSYEGLISIEADEKEYHVPINFRVVVAPKDEAYETLTSYPSPSPPVALDASEVMRNIGSCLFNVLVIAGCILGIRKIYLETKRININDIVAIQTIMPFITTETNSISLTLQPTQATPSSVKATQTSQGDDPPQQNVRARLPTDQEFKSISSIWDVNNISLLNLHSPGLRSYDVTVKTPDRLIWAYYWCASNTSTLQANLEHITVHFLIDNHDLPQSIILLSDRDITGWSCRYWATLLSNWKAGTVIQLDIKYILSDTIFDGYDTYPPGDYFFRLIVSVEQ